MPLSSYILINPKAKLPQLIVIGSRAQYQMFWTQVYEAISHSSLKVTEINFQDPTNLILKTELIGFGFVIYARNHGRIQDILNTRFPHFVS